MTEDAAWTVTGESRSGDDGYFTYGRHGKSSLLTVFSACRVRDVVLRASRYTRCPGRSNGSCGASSIGSGAILRESMFDWDTEQLVGRPSEKWRKTMTRR